MGFAQKEHTKPRLTYATAYGVGELSCEQFAVEHKAFLVLLTPHGELELECAFVHPDTHTGNLESLFENGIPQKQVAVESAVAVAVNGAPVVVICRP